MLSPPVCVGQSFLLPSVSVRAAALGINAGSDPEGLQVGLEQSCARSGGNSTELLPGLESNSADRLCTWTMGNKMVVPCCHTDV